MENEEKFRQYLPQELLFEIFKDLSVAIQYTYDPLKMLIAPPSYDHDHIINEEDEIVDPGDDEPFFSGQKFNITRTMRNYLVPEDD